MPAVAQAPSFTAFRKQFTLTKQPRTAALHLFADVRYLLWVNGQYVTRGPARFNPKGPEYDTIPVTPIFKARRAILSPSWSWRTPATAR